MENYLQPKSRRGRKPKVVEEIVPPQETPEPLWVSVSEAAKLAGVQTKTIRRAIEAAGVKFQVIGNRYLISFASLIVFLLSSTKLRNKFLKHGLGQYVDKWKQ